MITLNFYTTKLQSQELINLGMPINSADCYFTADETIHVVYDKKLFNRTPYTPCWSYGGLLSYLIQHNKHDLVIDKIMIVDNNEKELMCEMIKIIKFILRKTKL